MLFLATGSMPGLLMRWSFSCALNPAHHLKSLNKALVVLEIFQVLNHKHVFFFSEQVRGPFV